MSKIAPVATPSVALAAIQKDSKPVIAPAAPVQAETKPARAASPVAQIATLAPTTLAGLVLAQVAETHAAAPPHTDNGQGKDNGKGNGKPVIPPVTIPPPAPVPTPVLRAAPVETSFDASAPDRAAAVANQILQAGIVAASARSEAQAWATEQWSQSVQVQGQAALAIFAAMAADRGVRPLTGARPQTTLKV